MRMTSSEPTVFFVRDGDALRQLVRIGVDNAGTEREASLEVRAGGVREVLPPLCANMSETTLLWKLV